MKRLMKFIIPSVIATAVVVGGLKITFSLINYEYLQYDKFIHMETFTPTVKKRVYTDWTPSLLPEHEHLNQLDEIKDRGFIRVGYFKDALPFVFMNENENLVGFDVEMAQTLARELGVDLEMVKIKWSESIRMLNGGYVDIIMSGNLLSIEPDVVYSLPYFEQTFAFIVEDHRRDDFLSISALHKQDSLRVGIIDYPYYVNKLKQFLPDAVVIPLESPRDYFKKPELELDALLYTAEAGSAWSMVYPSYSVAVPIGRTRHVPVCFGLAKGHLEFTSFINRWILLKSADGTIDKVTDYWIYGQADELKEPRWCIASDVLGWY